MKTKNTTAQNLDDKEKIEMIKKFIEQYPNDQDLGNVIRNFLTQPTNKKSV